MSDDAAPTPEPPTPEQIYLERGLYTDVDYPDPTGLSNFLEWNGPLLLYCHLCKGERTFWKSKTYQGCPDGGVFLCGLNNRPYSCHHQTSVVYTHAEWQCYHCNIHQVYFSFILLGLDKLIKVGQSPSYAALVPIASASEYRAALGQAKFGELKRAIQLASHDCAAGAYTYLRRVFEHVIGETAKTAAQDDPTFDMAAWETKRMRAKIDALRGHLPAFVSETAFIYSALSEGVHTLSDKEAAEYFPLMRNHVELILDEWIAHKERERKLAAAREALSKLQASKQK